MLETETAVAVWSVPTTWDDLIGTSTSSPWLLSVVLLSLVALGSAVVWSLLSAACATDRLSLPPGPPQDPVLGNERQKPASHPWRTYAEWKKTYGDVIYLRYGSQRLVILNSARAAVELLDQRSSVYSSRPPAIMAHDLATRGLSVSMTPAGQRFRKHRKAFQAAFGPARIASCHSRIALEACVLARDLLHAPDKFDSHYKRFAASVVFSTVFACRIASPDAPVLKAVDEANRNFLHAFRPEGYLVDRYPLLRLLPRVLSPWRRLAEKWFAHEFGIYRTFYNRIAKAVEDGSAPACIATDVAESRSESGLTHDEAVFTTGSMIAAGSDSTAMTLACLTIAACKHPAAVARAQSEIDAVIGPDGGMPTFAHLAQLPYCRAFVEEVLRWRPFAPGGTPHYTLSTDVYREWRIPKDTTVMANLWAIHNDEQYWDDPFAFEPARHLAKDVGKDEGEAWPSSRRVFTFGFGRRICPGRQLAMLNLSLASVTLLWAFRFEHAQDVQGKPIEIDVDAFEDGLASHPLPFRCSIAPRSAPIARVIEEQYAGLVLDD